MRTYVRVGRARRSCTPTSTRSTPRSSSATIRACAAGRSSSAAGWCWRPATRRRRSASAPRWAAGRRGGCARRRSSCRRGWRPTPRRARRCSRVFDDTSPMVEGLSIDEAFLDVRGLERDRRHARARSPRGCGRGARAGRPADHRRRRAHEVPGQGGERRRQAGRAARRAARRRARASCTRCRSSGCGASARSPPRSCTRAGITTVGEVARAERGARWSSMLGRASGRHLHALAHNRDPRRCRPAAGGARSARSARSAAARIARPSSTRASSALVDRVTAPHARAPAASAARSSCACASTTSRGRRARARSRRRRADTRPCSPPRAALLAAAMPLIERARA